MVAVWAVPLRLLYAEARLLYMRGFSTYDCDGEGAMVEGGSRGRGLDEASEAEGKDGDGSAEMVRGSSAAPMVLDLAKSARRGCAGKGAVVGADAIFYPSAGRPLICGEECTPLEAW